MAGAKGPTVAAADEALAKEALEGLKRIRAKARLDKMAIPKPAPAVVRPAMIVAKPPRPVRPGSSRSRQWRSPWAWSSALARV